jgi:pimeloyl-ACP methyl ester carboxylesterase
MTTSLPAITKHIPTIFVWGNQDQMCPVPVGHQLEKLLPDVKWFFIDGAGHQVQTDQPERLGLIITEFANG